MQTIDHLNNNKTRHILVNSERKYGSWAGCAEWHFVRFKLQTNAVPSVLLSSGDGHPERRGLQEDFGNFHVVHVFQPRLFWNVLIQGSKMRTPSPKSKMPVSGLRLLESSPQICWLARMPLSNFHKTRTSNSETRPWKNAKGSFLYVFVCAQNWLYVRPFLPNFQTVPQFRGSFLSQGSMQTLLAYYVDCRCYVASHPKPGVLRSMRWMWHVAIAGSTLDRPPETMMWWVEHMSSTLARNLSTYWTIV